MSHRQSEEYQKVQEDLETIPTKDLETMASTVSQNYEAYAEKTHTSTVSAYLMMIQDVLSSRGG